MGSALSAGLSALAAWVPWLTLLVGFSPVLADLAGHLSESPEDSSFLLAVLLLGLAIAGSKHRAAAAPRRDGLIAVAAGAALEILGVATGSWSLARAGLPLAALGLARVRGHPPVPVMALGFFAVPIPDSLLMLTSPEIESALARAASALLRGLGAQIEAVGFSLVAGAGRVDLAPSDGGLPLAFALAALGWYGAVRVGGRTVDAVTRAAGWALLAPPVQLLAVVVAGALASAGASRAARLWMHQGVWLSVGALGLALLARRPGPSATNAAGATMRRR